MRIALAQITSTPDPTVNLRLVAESAKAAADHGADLLVLPEATHHCFGAGGLSTPAEGFTEWEAAVSDAARAVGIAVVVGAFRPADGGRVHNTAIVAGADGAILGRYDKIHLFDAFGFRESATVAPGDDTLVVEIAGVRVGVAICYDVRFPELFRRLADAGARAVVLPTSWGDGPGKEDQWRLLVPARALDATVFIAACDQARPEPDASPAASAAPTGIGCSMVVAPDGVVLGELGHAPGLLVVDVDPEEVNRVRERIPVLANRRLP